MKLERAVALVGLMGVGKSSIGRMLAERLHVPFVDTDDEIEREAGCSIPCIFEVSGEAGFRSRERRTVARLLGSAQPSVIATGGGTFVHPASRKILLERCLVIWLDADLETLGPRVAAGRERPLLTGNEPIAALRELALRRNPSYARAHLRFVSVAAPPEELVDRIISAIASFRLPDPAR